MATFTLRELLLSQTPISVGGVTITDVANNGPTNVGAQFIVIETVEGSSPGINISLDPRVANTIGATSVGILFEATTSGSILNGATMSLDGYGFAQPETSGVVQANLTQGRRDIDNIGINLGIDNSPGAHDTLRGSDDINGGPVPRFTFEYDMTQNVPGTVGTTAVRFDLAGGGGGGSGLPAGFDGLQYIASNPDLAAAFGANRAAGEQHYLSFGQNEGRAVDAFSETQYLKNYGDLQAAFGTNDQAATAHYITNGINEGRNDHAPSPAQIDSLQYIASNPDLIAAFGANAAAGQQHYAANGVNEGRVLDNFDETQYLHNYTDLQAAFGNNTEEIGRTHV